jgi:membrane-associated phospholipid phosphatase
MYGVILVLLQTTATLPAQAAPCREDAVLRWNETTLLAIKAEKTPPPAATRHLALVHAAVYDAVNAIYRTHAVCKVAAVPADGASPEAAAAIAAHRVLVELYPRQVGLFDATLDACLATLPDGPGKAAGVRLGQGVAERMLAWRAADGSSRRSDYTPGTGPGWWQPTLPDYRPALLPGWRFVTPFAIQGVAQFPPQDPPSLSSPQYTAAFQQVKALGAANSIVRTRDQTEIAHFWEDGEGTVTPPGHWNRIAQTVSRDRGLCLADNARLFALLNISLADAGILCWECKYRYSYWRPVHAIRSAAVTGNPDTVADPFWTPLLKTPPFPSYSSGHSTFSGTAATVLANFFGSDEVCFTSMSEKLPGVRRSFRSFWSAAEEAGWSRIYGGIHWDFDNFEGLRAGRALGDYVSRNFLLPVDQAARAAAATSFATRRRSLPLVEPPPRGEVIGGHPEGRATRR